MPSLVQGYQYDVFISYRHKDNMYDQWVTEFANNLTRELEAVFKGKISIYFDQNVSDGLHETHDVQDSLKEKVKCLVFIPILSLTYCDPNSFAWKNELIVFHDHASSDKFGLKISSSNGNVSSRILPVRIHDLTASDATLFEQATGGLIRAVDFIYRSAGVNRPLRAVEDEPRSNANGTYYRNQINKVALSVKELITGMLHVPLDEVGLRFEKIDEPRKTGPVRIKALYIIPVLLLTAIVVTYFISNKARSFEAEASGPNSIAVLPFLNLSDDPDQDYFSDGITEQIITDLAGLKDFKVIARTSVMKYKRTVMDIREIGRSLNVTHILEGSVRKHGDKIRITAQLIAVKDQSQVWGKDYDENLSDIFLVQDEVSTKIARTLKSKLTPEELSSVTRERPLNVEAYGHYLKGMYVLKNYYYLRESQNDFERVEREFLDALAIDPHYAQAMAGLADLYDTYAWLIDDNKKYLNLRDSLARMAFAISPKSPYVLVVYSYTFGNSSLQHPIEELDSTYKYRLMAYHLSPNDYTVCEQLANFFARIGLLENATQVTDHCIKLNPNDPLAFYMSGNNYSSMADYDRAVPNLERSLQLKPDLVDAHIELLRIKLTQNKINEAENDIVKIKRLVPGDDPSLTICTAMLLALKGKKDEALSLSKSAPVYVILGMYKQAIDKLKTGHSSYAHLKSYPLYRKLNEEPEFQELLRNAEYEHNAAMKRFPFDMD